MHTSIHTGTHTHTQTHRYPYIQPAVREVCKKHGVRYMCCVCVCVCVYCVCIYMSLVKYARSTGCATNATPPCSATGL